MSSPRVLLHLGLPKTATSSLQHNVFQKLHEQSRINFLGKCLDYEYKTGKVKVYNYSGKFIRDAAEGNLDVQEARQILMASLQSSVLNVFSDEGVMVAYPGKDNLSLVDKFERLNTIFNGCRVTVVITLRNPIDYLYSLYVQLYPDFCSRISEVDSIEKFIEKLFKDPNNILFESFFYDRWISDLQKKFDVTFTRYEKMYHREEKFYSTWADLLGISSDEFKEYFNARKVNVKNKSGKEVEKVRDFKALEFFFRKNLSSSRIIFVPVKCIYNVSGLKRLLNYRFSSKEMHAYPRGRNMQRLQDILKVENEFYES